MRNGSCVLLVTALCCALCSCDVPEDSGDAAGQQDRQAVSANPCTAVALTTPVQAWTVAAGQPIALTASATCPAGVTAEFEYLTRLQGSPWTPPPPWTTLAGDDPATAAAFATGSAMFRSLRPEARCFAVVARAVGSSDVSQAVASSACGTVAPPPPAILSTKVIAPSIAALTPYAVLDVVAGQGNVTMNIDGHFTAGDRIRAIRMLVTDNPRPGPGVGYSGATKLVASLRVFTPAGGSVPSTVATSNISDGSGAVQTLAMTGIDEPVATGGALHSVQVLDNIGVAPAVVWTLEVDYVPAVD